MYLPLIDERPVMFSPLLAQVFGINEAIVIQRVHFWLGRKKNIIGGVPWVYAAIDVWQDQFPFFSLSTLYRLIKKLETKKLLISSQHNLKEGDATKWYTLDYKKIEAALKRFAKDLEAKTDSTKLSLAFIEKKKPKETKEVMDLRSKPVIMHFLAAHKKDRGVEYAVQWGKCISLMRKLPESYTVQKLKNSIDEFFRRKDWHYKERGAGFVVWYGRVSEYMTTEKMPVKTFEDMGYQKPTLD